MKGEIFLMKYSKKDYLRYESTCKKRKVLNEAWLNALMFEFVKVYES